MPPGAVAIAPLVARELIEVRGGYGQGVAGPASGGIMKPWRTCNVSTGTFGVPRPSMFHDKGTLPLSGIVVTGEPSGARNTTCMVDGVNDACCDRNQASVAWVWVGLVTTRDRVTSS